MKLKHKALRVTRNVDQASQAQPDQRRGDRQAGLLALSSDCASLADNNAVDRTILLDNQTLRVHYRIKIAGHRDVRYMNKNTCCSTEISNHRNRIEEQRSFKQSI
ncbi:hypothetical protein P4C99_22225, partial [Pontiellaceae bacterium B1224]|nr:hypothetical protein [Pontiellaceae bacterium B1224]